VYIPLELTTDVISFPYCEYQTVRPVNPCNSLTAVSLQSFLTVRLVVVRMFSRSPEPHTDFVIVFVLLVLCVGNCVWLALK
jgi:hypothetical protein